MNAFGIWFPIDRTHYFPFPWGTIYSYEKVVYFTFPTSAIITASTVAFYKCIERFPQIFDLHWHFYLGLFYKQLKV